ncbi:MAG: endonuclease/exonuclease/phosphatase family protein [Candidatus Sumerlaeota bacterium]|nr:endonuclease/exonuclease/phosphatase family protein [Candidatus Sumerlaeota bacterium]
MRTISIAFWNVQNLFHWTVARSQNLKGKKWRGPATEQEYHAKLNAIAHIIQSMTSDGPPHILGLAEIGNEQVLQDLLASFPNDYFDSPIWIDGAEEDQSGLGLLWRRNSFTAKEEWVCPSREELKDKRGYARRPHSLIVSLKDQISDQCLYLSINHWKSNMGGPEKTNDMRVQTARMLGDRLSGLSKQFPYPVIVMGDFNADPYDAIFDEQRLRARRCFSTMNWWKNATGTFYNPCWRYLPPEAYFDSSRQEGYQERRPQTTFAKGWGVFDQMLFSKSFLKDEKIVFHESQFEYITSPNAARTIEENGRLLPYSWPDSWKLGTRGASDHFPMLARFSIREKMANTS